MPESIYQKAMGKNWTKLSPSVRRHYDLKAGESLQVTGVLNHVYHTAILTPLLQLTGCFGLLFPEQGENVRTVLLNSVGTGTDGQEFVRWERSLYFKRKDGTEKLRRFDSTVTLFQNDSGTFLLEKIAPNQAVTFRLSATGDGALRYDSGGFYSILGSKPVPVPSPAKISIREWSHPTKPNCFQMEFKLSAPFGIAFGYDGEFSFT